MVQWQLYADSENEMKAIIKAKYDAELKALEAQITLQQKTTTQQPVNESSLQEELDKYWDRVLRQIKDEKERERSKTSYN